MAQFKGMIDPFGRAINYLRVSVTDRCDLRCVYCMAEDMTFLPKRDLLTLEELDRICAAFIRLGTNKIRITGGEPLVRRNVMSLFQSLGDRLGEGGLKELTVTTNGTQLTKLAEGMYESENLSTSRPCAPTCGSMLPPPRPLVPPSQR